MGLSPRGRGKRSHRSRATTPQRSIPAWAGETSGVPIGSDIAKVYPRVGGGNRPSVAAVSACRGLSPRGRGKLGAQSIAGRRARSIPAWAGETPQLSGSGIRKAVYPRVGGGNARSATYTAKVRGLSPRGRGKRVVRIDPLALDRSIPAWAGETRRLPTPCAG